MTTHASVVSGVVKTVVFLPPGIQWALYAARHFRALRADELFVSMGFPERTSLQEATGMTSIFPSGLPSSAKKSLAGNGMHLVNATMVLMVSLGCLESELRD